MLFTNHRNYDNCIQPLILGTDPNVSPLYALAASEFFPTSFEKVDHPLAMCLYFIVIPYCEYILRLKSNFCLKILNCMSV